MTRSPALSSSAEWRPPRILLCGAALLAITYWLFANFAHSPPKELLNPTMVQLETAMSTQRANGLHRPQLYSGIALAIMAIVSVLLGWLVAGGVLAPLRTITATADRISDTNLHERLAMSGPCDKPRLLADTIDRLLARLEAAFDASDGSSPTRHMSCARPLR